MVDHHEAVATNGAHGPAPGFSTATNCPFVGAGTHLLERCGQALRIEDQQALIAIDSQLVHSFDGAACSEQRGRDEERPAIR